MQQLTGLAHEMVYGVPISAYIGDARSCLDDMFGVKDLSMSEGAHLRAIVLQLQQETAEEVGRALEGKGNLKFMTLSGKEAAYRWLFQLYEIHGDVALDQLVVLDKDQKPYKRVFEGWASQERYAVELCNRLNEGRERKNVSVFYEASPQMREYIRRVRERAHLL